MLETFAAITAALNAYTATQNTITALVNKASPEQVDAAIARHEARLQKLDDFNDRLWQHLPKPAPPAA